MRSKSENPKIEGAAMLQQFQIETQRAVVGRDEFIAWRCMDLPPVYRAMIPATCDAQELLEAEAAIRQMYMDDLKMYGKDSEVRRRGRVPRMLDWSNATQWLKDRGVRNMEARVIQAERQLSEAEKAGAPAQQIAELRAEVEERKAAKGRISSITLNEWRAAGGVPADEN